MGEIDAGFSKMLGVLGNSERFDAIRNLLHRGSVTCASASAAH
jgi:hypothetical protein